MREIVFDTETTGFDPFAGDRIVEIGAVELHNHVPTGRTYHQYINPERDMPEGAFEVHGLSIDFLKDFPVFAQIGQDFLDFIGDAKLVAHNAMFDLKFINAEFAKVGLPKVPESQIIDSLAIARKRFPGAQNSLDALCRRFQVDNSAREKHGALLDSEILAEVYLELIGGRQPDFGLADASSAAGNGRRAGQRPVPLQPRITDTERAAHQAFVEALGEDALWKTLGN